jgi:hypothetical protein
LFPLAAIAGTGAIKDFCVAAGVDTPVAVTMLLLASVGWFLLSSWRIWQAEGRQKGRILASAAERKEPADP